jgi:hypothetical protein
MLGPQKASEKPQLSSSPIFLSRALRLDGLLHLQKLEASTMESSK